MITLVMTYTLSLPLWALQIEMLEGCCFGTMTAKSARNELCYIGLAQRQQHATGLDATRYNVAMSRHLLALVEARIQNSKNMHAGACVIT